MKVTFLEACDKYFYHGGTSGPLGLAYIASYLDKHLDNEVNVSIEVDVEHIIKSKPDILGISAYTENFPKALRAAERVKKELNIPVIIGGKHITALPSQLKSCFDVGVVGDGEITLTELLKTYIDKKGFFPEDLINIQGIAFRDGESLYLTEQRSPLKELDILPPPKRAILNARLPGSETRKYWPQTLYTSRGCPYKCPFCIHSKIRFVTRYHSPQRVVEEISEIISKYPNQKNITIHDDLFTISKKRLKEIVDLIVSEKINRKVSFTSMCKSNLFDDEIAEMMKEMNTKIIAFGFESGDEQTLQYLKKDSSKVKENIRAINSCNKYGIHCAGYFIIGAPPETKEGLNKTYWFLRQNYPPMNLIGTFCLTPFPGTKTWDDAEAKGLVNAETENWDNYNYTNCEQHSQIFLNEHYDFDFFQEAYMNHFVPLSNKGRVFSYNERTEEESSQYSRIFGFLQNYNISSDDSILEVGTYFVPSIKNMFEENKAVTKFDHWIYFSEQEKIDKYEVETIKDKQFDVLVFNNSLDQFYHPYQVLENFVRNNLKENGKLIIIVKNPQYIENLLNIFHNRWDFGIAGFKKFDKFNQINIDNLREKLNCLNLNILNEIPIRENISALSKGEEPILSLLHKFIPNPKFFMNCNVSTYLIVATKLAICS